MEKKTINPKTPPILYQYRPPKKWAIDNLSQVVMYFNAPANFNDPYDCNIPPRWHDLTDEGKEFVWQIVAQKHKLPVAIADISQAHEEVIAAHFDPLLTKVWSRTRNRLGVACFSTRNDNLLMWSHYAGRGKGFCLAYALTTSYKSPLTKKVRYSKNRPNNPLIIRRDLDAMSDFLSCKSKDWKYEKEWRVFMATEGKNKKERDESRKWRYHPERLQSIYLGADVTDNTKARIRAILKETYPHAELWQGRLSKTEYKVEFDRIR